MGILFFPGPSAAQDLPEVTAFGDDPGNLRMYVHEPSVPGSHNGPRPLVIVLHGCGQSAEGFAEQSGWNELADRAGFVVVYPQQRTGNNASHCFNWFQEKDITPGTGEVESIHSMVGYAMNKWPIDSTRIFIVGVSAGAAMAVATAACYPYLFNGVASFAGAPYKCALGPGEAWRAMRNPISRSAAAWGELVTSASGSRDQQHFPRMLILQGLRDNTVDPSNAIALVDQWTAVHGIDNVADSTSQAFLDHAGLERSTYSGSAGDPLVVLYRFSDLGHVLPVDPGTGPGQGGHTGVFAVDKDVHATYLIAREFRLVD
ncbi:MAG: PHB depolymerase family esterase [Flavobacteriales bacterium]